MWWTYMLLGGLLLGATFVITAAVLDRSHLRRTLWDGTGRRKRARKAIIRTIIRQNGGKKRSIDVLDDGGEKDCEVTIFAETVNGIQEGVVIQAK